MSVQNPFQLSDHELLLIRTKVEEKRGLALGRERECFAIFDQVENGEELVALQFLYAFMPLVDLGDYSGELFLNHVRQSLKTKETMPWGDKISGELFLHFVLPYRITNETIEDYRPIFFEELYDRVKDLSMDQAILEINHWCHEKATYIAADPRTISPLSLIKAARGRCGEESALLVCALRSLGIPARQVYTPRWAHTDSNHAWVEAWADGEWFFLGACEPEPKLNMGWFVGPAQRAMLVHTKVPGTIYQGPEERVQVGTDYTELNLLERYAQAKHLKVSVKDRHGQPYEGATVEFQVFNYCGFASIASLETDAKGEACLTVGQGDLLIHAFSNESWGTVFASEKSSSVELILGINPPTTWKLTLNPPKEISVQVELDSELQQLNKQRIQEGEDIRLAYEVSFPKKEEAIKLGENLGLDKDMVWSVLEKSRGNSGEIIRFLEEVADEYGELALKFLLALAPKDLLDITSEILLDHLTNSFIYEGLYHDDDFINFILQPRISHEPLRAYREFFQGEFSLDRQDGFRHNPLELKKWIQQNIRHVSHDQVRGWPTPRGIYGLRVGSELSQKILFVAMARSFGIPARILTREGQCQYLHEDTWITLSFGSEKFGIEQGILDLYKLSEFTGELEYFQNFSLARLFDQQFHTFRFKGLDEEAFNDEEFTTPLKVTPGTYRLTTGQRLPDGQVLATLSTFTIEGGQLLAIPVIYQGDFDKENLGSLPSELKLPIDPQNEGEVVLAWLDPNREPTKHLLRDLNGREAELEALEVPLLFYTDRLEFTVDKDLPTTAFVTEDRDFQVLKSVLGNLKVDLPQELPMVFVVDATGIIRFASAGYKLGTGAQILATLGKG